MRGGLLVVAEGEVVQHGVPERQQVCQLACDPYPDPDPDPDPDRDPKWAQAASREGRTVRGGSLLEHLALGLLRLGVARVPPPLDERLGLEHALLAREQLQQLVEVDLG